MDVDAFRKSCGPAYAYLVISLLALGLMAIQNSSMTGLYCVGAFSCSVNDVGTIFAMKLIYICFWTWVLTLMCNAGYSSVAWSLVLLPIIFLFIFIAYMYF